MWARWVSAVRTLNDSCSPILRLVAEGHQLQDLGLSRTRSDVGLAADGAGDVDRGLGPAQRLLDLHLAFAQGGVEAGVLDRDPAQLASVTAASSSASSNSAAPSFSVM